MVDIDMQLNGYVTTLYSCFTAASKTNYRAIQPCHYTLQLHQKQITVLFNLLFECTHTFYDI
jgi:hypothetical protein